MTEQTDPQQIISHLQAENQQLRSTLEKLEATDERNAAIRNKALKVGGSLLLPAFDRHKVVRSFLGVFDTVSRFAGPREEWPDRDEILIDARAFALAFLRLTIRRRSLMLLLSMVAFVIPGVQIWLVVKQNEIIENQNRFFEIEVYDIVARSMTSGELTAKQMTSALLSKNPDFLRSVVEEVFQADFGGDLTKEDLETRDRRLRDAATRGHLVLPLVRAMDLRAKEFTLQGVRNEAQPMFKLVIDDAANRVPSILRVDPGDSPEDRALAAEVNRYLFNLGSLMRKHWSLAVSTGTEQEYYATIAPLMVAVTGRRVSFFGGGSPFSELFFERSLRELLVDLAVRPSFGSTAPVQGKEEALLKQGFEALKAGVGAKSGVNWGTLKKLAKVGGNG